MTFPTDMKDNITDSITDETTQTHTKVLDEPPADSGNTLLIATEQALENAAYNAQHQQGYGTLTEQAEIAQALSTLYEVDTATSGSTHKIYESE